METPVDEEIKCFDDTAAFIYSSVSSDLPKEPCEVESTAWFVKTESTSPVTNTMDVDQYPGLQLEYDPSLKMLIKTEVTSEEHVEERLRIPPGLPIELCEIDSKAWFVETQPTSPVGDPTGGDQDPGAANKLMAEGDRSVQSSYSPTAAQLQSEKRIQVLSVPKKLNGIKCPFCEYYTVLQDNLKIHLGLVHAKTKAFQCGYCEYRTSSKTYMKKHIDGLHKKITLKCPHCDTTTKWKNTLKRHINSAHNKIWAFQCDFCEYKSNSKSTLNAHIDAVHKKITLQCPQCNYKTKWINTLKRHIDSAHNKIWAFHCALCQYKSNSKNCLKIHIDAVHKKITLQCPHCNYKTKRKNTLKKHIESVHTEIWPFHCAHCEYKSKWKPNLDRHLKTVHKKETFCT